MSVVVRAARAADAEATTGLNRAANAGAIASVAGLEGFRRDRIARNLADQRVDRVISAARSLWAAIFEPAP